MLMPRRLSIAKDQEGVWVGAPAVLVQVQRPPVLGRIAAGTAGNKLLCLGGVSPARHMESAGY